MCEHRSLLTDGFYAVRQGITFNNPQWLLVNARAITSRNAMRQRQQADQERKGGPRGWPAGQADCACSNREGSRESRSMRDGTEGTTCSGGSNAAGAPCAWQNGHCLKCKSVLAGAEGSWRFSLQMLKRFAPVALHSSPSALPVLSADRASDTDGASAARSIAKHANQAAKRCSGRFMDAEKIVERQFPGRHSILPARTAHKPDRLTHVEKHNR